MYVVVDDYARALYKRAPHVRGCGSIQGIQGGRRDRVWEEDLGDHDGQHARIIEGKMRDGVKLYTTVPYYPASNGVAEEMIGVRANIMPCALAMVGSKSGTVVQPISPFAQ